VGERKSFLLRVDGALLDALRAWAEDDLRSLNGQIEFVLREALKKKGRLKEEPPRPEVTPSLDPDAD
jgi:hypothetical protein